eukprot:Phypoly_transcript_11570.p1 GENE.Phypoly_transcript_11570~~Phypoly_transcript_11570.p1  ORF type:complete len:250 (+),score=17.10 Phypoly_transcript_11570:402-1151(+)
MPNSMYPGPHDCDTGYVPITNDNNLFHVVNYCNRNGFSQTAQNFMDALGCTNCVFGLGTSASTPGTLNFYFQLKLRNDVLGIETTFWVGQGHYTKNGKSHNNYWIGGPGVTGGTLKLSAWRDFWPDNCATAFEDQPITLTCRAGQIIDTIDFASYGTPHGYCDTGFYTDDACHSSSSVSVTQQNCIGNGHPYCTFTVNNDAFGDPCFGTSKRFYTRFTCRTISNSDTQTFLIVGSGDATFKLYQNSFTK